MVHHKGYILVYDLESAAPGIVRLRDGERIPLLKLVTYGDRGRFGKYRADRTFDPERPVPDESPGTPRELLRRAGDEGW